MSASHEVVCKFGEQSVTPRSCTIHRISPLTPPSSTATDMLRFLTILLFFAAHAADALSIASLGRPVRHRARSESESGTSTVWPSRFSTEADARTAKLVTQVLRVGHRVRAEQGEFEDFKGQKVDVSTFRRAREIKQWLKQGDLILCFAKPRTASAADAAEEVIAYGRCSHSNDEEVAFVEPTIPREVQKTSVAAAIINGADGWARKQKAKTLRLLKTQRKVGLAEQFFVASAHAI